MDRTFDSLTEAVRSPSMTISGGVLKILATLLGKFLLGVALGGGLWVGLVIARASIGP